MKLDAFFGGLVSIMTQEQRATLRAALTSAPPTNIDGAIRLFVQAVALGLSEPERASLLAALDSIPPTEIQ